MPIRTEPVTINLGPQHPSTHGVFRLRVTFDGEIVVDVDPVFGYMHRGTEKLAETRSYVQIVTLTDRLDWVSSMSNNLAYVRAVESLSNIEVPERAKFLRVITAELQRIASHFMATGFLVNDMGAFATPLMYCFRERERILDLFEILCGARITLSYMRPGGVFQDAPKEFWLRLDDLIKEMPGYIDELEGLVTTNEIVLARSKNVGVLTAEQCINGSLSGPMLRASSVNWDIRKSNPYEVYDKLSFDTPLGINGDVFDRYLVRIKEMRESLKIISQCVEMIPEGPIRSEVPYNIRPPDGDTYSSVEAPKGEFGVYLISDGSNKPYRCKIRAPGFSHLQAMDYLIRGHMLADVPAVLGSLDIVFGEVDR